MNRPYSRCPPSLHALRTDGIEVMSRDFSGGKHVINFSNTRNRGRVCFFSSTENEQLFTLKTTVGKLWVEVIIYTFLDTVATVDVLAASSNDIDFVETQTVHFACLLTRRFVFRE